MAGAAVAGATVVRVVEVVGAFDIVGEIVGEIVTALGTAALDGELDGEVDGEVDVDVRGWPRTLGEANGIGGARVLGGAKGMGGANGFDGVTVLAELDPLATLGTLDTLVDEPVEPPEPVDFGVLGAGATGWGKDAPGMTAVTIGEGSIGAGVEIPGSCTIDWPGGTETTDNVTLANVTTGTVGLTGCGFGALVELAVVTPVALTELETGASNPAAVVGDIDSAGPVLMLVTIGTFVAGRSLMVGRGVASGRVPATITGGVACPTPIRGISGPALAPAAFTKLSEGAVDGLVEFAARIGRFGPAETGDPDAPETAGDTEPGAGTAREGAIGAARGSRRAGSVGAMVTGRSRALAFGAANAGLAEVLLGFSAAESRSPPALVTEARVKLMSLTRSLAIRGNSTAAL